MMMTGGVTVGGVVGGGMERRTGSTRGVGFRRFKICTSTANLWEERRRCTAGARLQVVL
jgi:hypothetical protein